MKKNRLFNLTLLLVTVLFVQESLAQTTLEGHTGDVTSVAFSPDGKILSLPTPLAKKDDREYALYFAKS